MIIGELKKKKLKAYSCELDEHEIVFVVGTLFYWQVALSGGRIHLEKPVGTLI